MKEKTKSRWRWFHYLPEDGKAAQTELDRLAEAGWALTDLWGPLARFEQTGREMPRYWVELARPMKEQAREDFFRLCREAGWEPIRQSGALWYFRSIPGTEPAPIQTDGWLEWEEVWRKELLRSGLDLLVCVVLWVAYFAFGLHMRKLMLWEVFLNNWAMVLSGLLALLLVRELLRGIRLLRCRRWFRRAMEETGCLPIPDAAGAKRRGLRPLVTALLLILVVATGLLGKGGTMEQDGVTLRRFEESFLARHEEYWNFEGGRTYLGHYDCSGSPWLAALVEQGLVERERTDPKDSHLHSPVPLEKAELGFDSAWLARRDGYSFLVARQGEQVFCLEGEGDFTDPAARARAWEDLQGIMGKKWYKE